MNIQKNLEGEKMTVILDGELNTLTAPKLQSALQDDLDQITELTIDLSAVRYISSAGLRVILEAEQELEDRGGGVTVRGAREEVREVFEVTGFDEMIHLE